MAAFIKYVFWDFGDTLVGLKPQVKKQIADWIFRKCGQRVEIADLDEAMRSEWNSRAQTVPSDATRRVVAMDEELEFERAYYSHFFACILPKLGIEDYLDVEQLTDLAQLKVNPKSYYVFPDVMSIIEKVKQSGIKQAIVSNGYRSAEGILAHSDLQGKFDFEIWSYRCGTSKPEPRIFEIALEKAGCRAEEVIFVDDRGPFVEAARRLGMLAIRIDRLQFKSIVEAPFPIINNLMEIEKFIPCREESEGRSKISRITVA